MDNPYYEWSPIVSRPALRWPNDARVALAVIVSIDEIEWRPPARSLLPPSTVRFGPYPQIFDVHEVSPHQYGNRVGVFRVLDVLARCGIRPTAAIDALSARRCRRVLEACVDQGSEIIGHGISASQMISQQMTEAEEREYLTQSITPVEEACGTKIAGWMGMDYGESARTVSLLAELGLSYVCDWPNDEQPYPLRTTTGAITSLPASFELDDAYVLRERGVSVQHWLRMVTETFDRLWIDGESSGRVLLLNVHPYVIGQPFRIRFLARALGHIVARPGVWVATGSEIVDWYRAQQLAPEH